MVLFLLFFVFTYLLLPPQPTMKKKEEKPEKISAVLNSAGLSVFLFSPLFHGGRGFNYISSCFFPLFIFSFTICVSIFRKIK